MTDNKLVDNALHLAGKLHVSEQANSKNEFAARLEPILQEPSSKNFLIRLMDVAFRSEKYAKVSNYVLRLFDKHQNYRILFSPFEKVLVAAYRSIGKYFPGISIPLMLAQIKKVTSPILFFVDDPKFRNHARKRASEGVKLNVNLIGEALIGENEAAERIDQYRQLLRQKDINYISIKISTIYSQTSALAFEHTVNVLSQKLSLIYDELIAIHGETGEWKFVNLDMEEYRDLHLTIHTFIQTLSQEKYKSLRAGLVLQAYLPDSYEQLDKVLSFAQQRYKNGGAPIKIRIVKGANMEMEKTESSLEDWPLAPFSEKVETDANFKKILLKVLKKETLEAMQIGVASHNIFDLAFALQIVQENGLKDYVDFEMLEGMANQTVNKLMEQGAKVLLYTPIVKPQNYNSAIAYLVRRLDEGTQDGNFLKEGFDLQLNSAKWDELKTQFLNSIELIEKIDNRQRRNQDRGNQKPEKQNSFRNVPNTDWNLKANRDWLKEVKRGWENPEDIEGTVIPVIGGKAGERREEIILEGWNGKHPWKYQLATTGDYSHFLGLEPTWNKKTANERAELLKMAAVEIEKNRGELMAVAVKELGKTFDEVDVEVSEAIDFANFYAESAKEWGNLAERNVSGGVNLILSPWNFPLAIPIGGVLASLAAGKRAILKPSTNATATAYLISKCLWAAGITQEDFAFLPTKESNLDEFLSSGNTFDAVILTGGTDTAKFLLKRNPELKLYAETGGKNSTIVTSLADREQAIKNVVQSAFGNAGQKCSATSLLILEEEVFEDAHFKTLLKDATMSRYFGNPWNNETNIGPLGMPVSDKLKYSIEHTPDEQWLIKPKLNGGFFLSPGIKWGVTTEDYEYQNELFGPILSVMKAKNLEEAVSLANGVEYGLTSGLESLDPKEVEYWKQNIKAGNLYVNRSTTGAIVLRQPFGGIKASSFGFGMKAGGLNYVGQFMTFNEPDLTLEEIQKDYQKWYTEFFSKEIDPVGLRGQHNISRYLKPEKILLLVDKSTPEKDLQMVVLAAKTLNIPLEIFSQKDSPAPESVIISEWTDLKDKLSHDICIRSLTEGPLTGAFAELCIDHAYDIFDRKPSVYGRLELLNYLSEQSFSYNYHRYGNLLGEKRD
ncbi:bifunctional proline dehydrogenase/L-glutamate gamma-semialdehyde dehydrogenase [Jiulongibacter sediminis]|uniref:bifunctional proline dehydrogenase/L-glutamate gamma-semialdehyde dehydrogenase n=1 Tax=Jiulongibacter sediminis TaxID=1605367 RepID=UPI0026EFF3F1|nr:bifunctional proline dehydrogenase/L-glutamate gamma-semialdehyde dehydrogenase [Jiulongibacter sediminis]